MKKIILFFAVLFFVICRIQAQLQVVTNPSYARGATVAFGRSTITGVALSNLQEHGFCWSDQPEPTILDNRTTKTFSNNGYIYRMENLTPATVYYARAYAITNDSQVSYGDVIKIITIPKGNTTYTYNNAGSAAENTRIIAALQSATAYYCDLTSIKSYNVSCNYSAGTPTADCSYGGYMRMGPNADYQRTGTVLHEMAHGVGVGQHSLWYGPNSPLRAGGTTGLWLGERANNVLRFLDNNPNENITGDTQHFWPTASSITFGINGSWEDTGSELLYTGNCLIIQAFGEDGLPPTSAAAFATPAYTFLHDDTVKYYIKNESDVSGTFLMENVAGNLVNNAIGTEDVLKNDSAAWYLRFDPATRYYQIINVATGKYFTYKSTGTNGVAMTAVATLSSANSFQLMGSRNSIAVGAGSNKSSIKGYWIIRPQATLNPPCFVMGSNGTTSVSTFNFGDAATAQRWFLLTGKDVQKINPDVPSPTVAATIESSSWIHLSWDDVINASGYRIYRASYPDSVYVVLRNSYTATSYDDNFGLTANTVYWYKVCSLSISGESLDAVPVKAITNKTNGEAGDDLTGIDEVATAGFRFYPNPVKAGQQIFVGNGNFTGKFGVEIVDMTGKTVLRFSESAPVYAPQVKGIYFVKFTVQQKTEVCRLIVN